ncbi:MAG TPA: N-acetylglucosamine-6-phosphate deacetylase [Candidatus Binatia bacterium]|nr:N-acetylglucosamine-6-phosphate deacetylase [Candidatus Binatia bacterium]
MNEGELHAWHYATRELVRLRWTNGTISAIERTNEKAPDSLWLAPGLVDLQINGFSGVDFQQDNVSQTELERAVRGLFAAGCTRLLLTIVTDKWDKMLARLQHYRKLRAQSPLLQSAIAGWHIEGPFLSDKPGFAGAHDASLMIDPMTEHMHELRKFAGDDLVLLTLAPERLEAIATIALATSLGMKVSLGHTNAPHKRLSQAIKAGAIGFTHLANGCPRELDRHDNILWRIFETKGLKVSLIPDGFHVSGPLFRLIHRELGGDSIYYTSDAMAAAGAPPGRYTIGRLEVDVAEDGVVRQPGSPLFAGSGLEPIRGVFRAAEMLDSPWQETWIRLSDSPAQMMGLDSGLQTGKPATFCLLQVTPENWLQSLKVYLNGEIIAANDDFPVTCARASDRA